MLTNLDSHVEVSTLRVGVDGGLLECNVGGVVNRFEGVWQRRQNIPVVSSLPWGHAIIRVVAFSLLPQVR